MNRVNYPLSEKVQTPLREKGQRQARCKGIIRTAGSRTTSWTDSTFNLVNAADIIDTVAPDTATSRHSGDEMPQGRRIPRVQSRGTETKIRERTQVLNPCGTEFESIRLTTRIEECYRNCVPDEELTALPAQKGILRSSDSEQAIQPSYLYDRDKDDRDLHRDHMVYDPPQRSSKWAPRPYSLAEIMYEYDTEDEG